MKRRCLPSRNRAVDPADQVHGVVLEIVPRAGRVVDQAIGLPVVPEADLAVPADSGHRQSRSRPSKSDSFARGLIRARNEQLARKKK